MNSLILGTAGHIDHGKTSVVKALTGVDTDRLPEEKARGITIDLGFAALNLSDVRLGIVDVPGHERFIRNMLAGATGIDLALLVVAADDGVMPQTREHLEILQYLGVSKGVIAITKADLVDETTLEVAMLDVRELVKETFLESAPMIATAVTTGRGISELKEALRSETRGVSVDSEGMPFRMAIDRVFVRQGHGTIVTGSVISGELKVEDAIAWHHDGQSEQVRVRGLAHHGKAVERVHRGQRAAINLAGVPHDLVHRGQELAASNYLNPSRLLSVRLRASPNGRRIKHRLTVRLHLGTAEVMGKVAILDRDAIEPGQWALAQIFLDEPLTAVWGQAFVIRDSGAETTLGGGTILESQPIKHRRNNGEILAALSQLTGTDVDGRVAAAAWLNGLSGIRFDEMLRMAGAHGDAPTCGLLNGPLLVEFDWHPTIFCHSARVDQVQNLVLKSLAARHAAQPLVTSHDRSQFVSEFPGVCTDTMLNAIIDRMFRAKLLVGDAKRIALASFKPKLTANQRKLKDKIVEAHRVAGFAPPEPASFANLAMGNAAALGDIYEVAVAEGLLVKVTGEIYLHADTEVKLRAIIAEKLAGDRGATMAEIRDWLGSTRKFAVPLCEYLDRVGVTERRGDMRHLKK